MRYSLLAILVASIMLAACTPEGPATPDSLGFPTPASTLAPVVENAVNSPWLTYHDPLGGFSIKYPNSGWAQSRSGAYPITFTDVADGTTALISTAMQVNVTPNATDCKQTTYAPDAGTTAPVNVTINGTSFVKESGTTTQKGEVFDWTSFSTMKGSNCINITFVLHSAQSTVFSTPPAPFDKTTALTSFDQLMNSFQFDK